MCSHNVLYLNCPGCNKKLQRGDFTILDYQAALMAQRFVAPGVINTGKMGNVPTGAGTQWNIGAVSTGRDSYIGSTVSEQYGEVVFAGNQTCEYCGTIGRAGAVRCESCGAPLP